MHSKSVLQQKPRKKWDTPSELPLSLKQNSDSDYYSDSFESYSSESVQNSDLISEIKLKLATLSDSQISSVLSYVKSMAESLNNP